MLHGEWPIGNVEIQGHITQLHTNISILIKRNTPNKILNMNLF